MAAADAVGASAAAGAAAAKATSGMPEAKKARTGELQLPLPVVLGSSSKWRQQLFKKHFPNLGADFMEADIDEKAIRRECPKAMTVAIAQGKSDALLPRLADREVLLATLDQVIVCNGQVREKPENEAEARTFLDSYRSGKGAECVNGVVVVNTKTGKRCTGNEVATAYWKPFPDQVVDEVIKRGDVMTCAGGFTVEDPTLAPFLDRLEGSQEAVEGLPLKILRSLLWRAGAPAVSHVIFDMDGLLLDTEPIYTKAQQEILDPFGKTFTWELKSKMMGRKAVDAAQWLIDELGIQDKLSAEELLAQRDKKVEEAFRNAPLLPGAEKLIRHLHKHGVPIAVATSSHTRHFELKTTLHRELFGLMHHIVTGDMVANSKPHPEIFLKAASLFEGGASPPGSTLVFEDAPTGVQAALAAGMQVCHIPDENLAAEDRGAAHCEHASLSDFRPEEWGLAPY